VAESIRHLADLGATSVVIQPTEDEPDLEGLLHFVGTEVKPLLAAG
jgi:5,10-methylenetetrahydromethanopterin reductase